MYFQAWDFQREEYKMQETKWKEMNQYSSQTKIMPIDSRIPLPVLYTIFISDRMNLRVRLAREA